ncbi:hypothetical protein PPL_06731 [Heterostelium album PN500]|uniref:RNA polymerase II nuclear localization protein SLC7A6OS n=1 Tax=Heterostelium pallidum (strain ATCC 26659 / Pp 5 / PN500) TaxID=670386 RepID=D3BFJ7_HETP5|nr:hypothetical protein PPL_06731 [Heterostelium album PN500]EFA79911.1 hypothetical protein PPL_06731 [Heterostelium album PN500]|eukprot:XP_020432032.1 hypothetical protein PPL_06731 [Heterostelium album PN500]
MSSIDKNYNNLNSNNNNNNNSNDVQDKPTTPFSAVKAKKIFSPNITKHKFKTDSITNPTSDFVQKNKRERERDSGGDATGERPMNQEDEDALLALMNQNISSNTVKITPKNEDINSNNNNKKVFLKIKRKIDEETLTSIVIERPKKKALLDTFKQFSLTAIDDKQDNNNNNIEVEDDDDDEDENNNNKRNKKNRNNNIDEISQSIKESSSAAATTTAAAATIKTEKSLFTLFTSIDETNLINSKSKLEKRFEEFKEKGTISSPKILKAKQENTIKKRNENRYRQIKSNRVGLGKEDNIIELEKTDELDEIMSGLTKEEEKLICNFKPLLREQLDKRQEETKYVYDYYYLDPVQAKNIDISMIETVVLPPDEDDIYDGLDLTDDDQSTDSENWYVDYPDESSNGSDSLFDENEDDEDYDNHDYYNDGNYDEDYFDEY